MTDEGRAIPGIFVGVERISSAMAQTKCKPASECAERQEALLRANVALLRQGLALVEGLTEAQFCDSPKGMEPHRASSQLRHVLEFYECFLEGLAGFHIDYDARQRDESIERSRRAALTRIEEILDRLESEPELHKDSTLFVRAEDATHLGLRDPFTTSSVSRELVVLSSHTIHHFALVAMTLRGHGVIVEERFGVAPSTLSFRAANRRKVVAIGAA